VEENLRRSMLLSRGDPMIFISRPISLTFLIFTLGLIALVLISAWRRSARNRSRRPTTRAADTACPERRKPAVFRNTGGNEMKL
jgi:TctA family transporter